jgi:UDP-N-acetylmuramoyl-tripeptide--D-alanyl-D-alanine ligase
VTTPFWTLARAGAALELPALDDRPLSGICTDTRSITPGALFVALRGERFDAHDFLGQAVATGAAALVVADGVRAAGLGVPVLVVDDTLHALGALARYQRRAWTTPVIAVGGSNGKTSTKELLRGALGSVFDVHATTGNLNNQIGVPLTLLAAPPSADLVVVEVGTNHPGEIALLRDIAEADIAVVTTVQEEHLEGFGDLAGVMAEELSLCDGVACAVVPAAELDVVAEASRRARRVVTAGLDVGDVRPAAWGMGADGCGWFRLGEHECRVPVPGVHNLANAMLAVAVARECGISDASICVGIARTTLPAMRSAVTALGEAVLINDAYNANPGSMRAALALLTSLHPARPKVAILGSMRELGVQAPALHDTLIREALATSVEVLGVVGDCAAAAARVAPGDARIVAAETPDALWPLLEPRLPRQAVVLLKGSRGVRLEQLLPALHAWAGVA